MHVQLEQQVSNKFRVGCEFIIRPLMVFQHGAPGSQGPSLVLKVEAKKALNVSALSTSLFVR